MRYRLAMIVTVCAGLLAACSGHVVPITQWGVLSRYKPNNPVLVETPDGMFYVTPKAKLSFVPKKGGTITRNWQEISLAKNIITAISVDRKVYTFPVQQLERIVAHGKVAGEITGIKSTVGPVQRSPGMGAGRPMFR